MGFSTTVIHAGNEPDPATGRPVSVPSRPVGGDERCAGLRYGGSASPLRAAAGQPGRAIVVTGRGLGLRQCR